MGDRKQAQAFYKAGMEHYRAKRYEEAISSFDRAVSLGNTSFVVLDGKAAAMNQLDGWRSAAYELSVKLCKVHGEKSHKPWYRKATVLYRMKMYEAALSSLSRAQSLTRDPAAIGIITTLHSQCTEGKRVATERRLARAADEDAARLADAKSKLNFIHLLPPDVIVLVADAAMAAGDFTAPLRMAGTCGEWRSVMLDHKRAWSRLTLSPRRPVEKVRTYLDRAGIYGVREVRISDRIGADLAARLAEVLGPVIPNVEHLYLGNNYRHFVVPWQGKMRRVKSIIQRKDYGGTGSGGDDRVYVFPPNTSAIAYGLLHPSCTSLRVLDLDVVKDTVQITKLSVPSNNPPGETYVTHSRRVLKGLKTFRMADGTLGLDEPHDLRALLRWLPVVEVVELAGFTRAGPFAFHPGQTFSMNGTMGTPGPSEDGDDDAAGTAGDGDLATENGGEEDEEEEDLDPDADLVVPNLQSLTIAPRIGMRDPLLHLSLPSLRRLSLNAYFIPPNSASEMLSHPSLRPSFAALESLDIGRTFVFQPTLVALLRDMNRLRFLNVSFSTVDNDFLEALVVDREPAEAARGSSSRSSVDRIRKGKEVLLPNLTALSIAGNESITSGPVNRFVLSRSPAYLEWKAKSDAAKGSSSSQASSSGSQTGIKRSAFAPTRRSTTPTVSGVASSSSTSGNTSQTSTSETISATQTPTLSGDATKDKVATMTWLCLDHCTNPSLDVAVLVNLRKSLKFISYNLGPKVNEDRVRGRGEFAWDMDWKEGCGKGGAGCHLRKRPGTDNSYYVHHVCNRASVDENESGTEADEEQGEGSSSGARKKVRV